MDRSIAAVAAELGADPRRGLDGAAALARLARDGPNEISEEPPKPAWRQFVGQFSDLTVLALIGAAIVAVAMGWRQAPGGSLLHRFGDAIAIGIIVLINAATGFIQERKAERALRALRQLGAPMAKVVRSGRLTRVPAAELVAGDLIELGEGDRTPADARLVETSDLVVNEAALTGESIPVDKLEAGVLAPNTPLAERANMVFLGTHVARGHARALVVATGMRTELGHIAKLLSDVESPMTPLQVSLRRFGILVVAGSAVMALVVFVIALVRLQAPIGFLLLTAVSLAVAAIPEGLPAITTIVLALGVQRMVRHNALVRRLAAVETLGSADVICTDKTGTLTQNRMLVRRIYAGQKRWEVERGWGGAVTVRDAEGQSSAPDFVAGDALSELVLACGAAPAASLPDDGEGSPSGDPTDAALLRLFARYRESSRAARHDYETLRILPFDRDRKMASAILCHERGVTSHTHGAPEAVLARTGFVLDSEAREVPLEATERAVLEACVEEWARDGLRVLALARSRTGALGLEQASLGDRAELLASVERDLVLIGLIGLADPPRPEVADAIAVARAAGIRTIMITGDHPRTGAAVAREIGLLAEGESVITGSELDELGAEELDRRVDSIGVVARATAANKLRLVQALRARGHVVAMTGDGVNDAPAIKSASIGVAMGRAGTDVTREAADMVLLDDNYATIVSAVEQGRIVYGNIKRFIVFLFAVNTGLVLTVLVGALLGWPPILTPTQILWINLITNGMPALALGMEPVHLDPMKQQPRAANESLVSRSELVWLMGYGALMAVLGIATFRFSYALAPESLPYARTATFSVLALSPLFHALNSRSRRDSVFTLGFFSNWRLLGAFALALGLQAIAVYVPGLETVFGTAPLTLRDGAFILGLSASVWCVGELEKALTARLVRRAPKGSGRPPDGSAEGSKRGGTGASRRLAQ